MITFKFFKILTDASGYNTSYTTHNYSTDAQPWKENKYTTMLDQDKIRQQKLNHVMRKSSDDTYPYYA